MEDTRERGSILILIALLITVLVGMIGLFFDFGLLAQGRTKQNFIADYSALSALQAYYSYQPAPGEPPATTFAIRMPRALAAAQQVSGLAKNFLTLEYMSSTPRAPGDLNITSNAVPDPTTYGQLVPGRWYNATTCFPTCSFPVGCLPTDTDSCFLPLPPGDFSVNAMRVDLQLPSSALYVARFMSAIGAAPVHLMSSSIATMTPRRIEALVDVSPSVAYQSHPYDQLQFAMRLSEGASGCGAGGGLPCRCTGSGYISNPCEGGVCDFLDNSLHGATNLRDKWAATTVTRKRDFQCFIANFTLNGVPKTQHYLIDTAIPPEPYTSIMTALHGALDTFDQRGVNGDRVGAIFFDMEKIDEREFRFVIPKRGVPEFDELLQVTDIASGSLNRVANLRYGIERHALFPRFQILPEMNTDIPTALYNARESIVNEQGFNAAENSIALFTDGQTTCFDPSPPAGPTLGPVNDCRNRFDHLVPSLDQITPNNPNSKWAEILADDRIAVHIGLFGSDVLRPHQMLLTSTQGTPPTSCMSENESRALNPAPLMVSESLGYVGPVSLDDACYPDAGTIPNNAFCNGPPAVTQYFYPNRLYWLAHKTGGLYLPVTQPCPDNDPLNAISCRDDVTAMLNAQCAMGTAGAPVVVPGGTYTDADGRLICDAQCRTLADQMKDAFTRIIGSNPYVLVAPPPP